MSFPEYDGRRNTVELNGSEGVTIEIGDHAVILEKLYGPLGFADLRVTVDVNSARWVIERRSGPDETWTVWVEIPAQLAIDFADPHTS